MEVKLQDGTRVNIEIIDSKQIENPDAPTDERMIEIANKVNAYSNGVIHNCIDALVQLMNTHEHPETTRDDYHYPEKLARSAINAWIELFGALPQQQEEERSE